MKWICVFLLLRMSYIQSTWTCGPSCLSPKGSPRSTHCMPCWSTPDSAVTLDITSVTSRYGHGYKPRLRSNRTTHNVIITFQRLRKKMRVLLSRYGKNLLCCVCLTGQQRAVVSDERFLCVPHQHQDCSQPAGLRAFLHQVSETHLFHIQIIQKNFFSVFWLTGKRSAYCFFCKVFL